jgi:hypothetical protein
MPLLFTPTIDAAITSLIPALSCRPNAAFTELSRLSPASVADEVYTELSGDRWISDERSGSRDAAGQCRAN